MLCTNANSATGRQGTRSGLARRCWSHRGLSEYLERSYEQSGTGRAAVLGGFASLAPEIEYPAPICVQSTTCASAVLDVSATAIQRLGSMEPWLDTVFLKWVKIDLNYSSILGST